jgi:DNA-binding GntR family transcriptional regulator
MQSMRKKAEGFAAKLRERIVKGEFGPSGGIPETARLAEQYSLAPATIYKGISLLVNEELLIAGSTGFYVNSTAMVMAQYVQPFHKAIEARGLTSFVENIDPVEVVIVPDDIAVLFGLPSGVSAVRRLRLQGEVQGQKKVPHRVALYYYLIKEAQDHIQRLQDDPGLDLLVEIGPVQQKIHEKPISRLPTEEEARRLDIYLSIPVMELQTTNYDIQGNVLLIQDIVFRADKVSLIYDYEIENRKP